jgi:hypothetical protein
MSDTEQTIPAAPAQGTHHYILTLQKPMRSGVGLAVSTSAGHCTPSAGMTRYDVYQWLIADLVRHSPELAGASVLCFDLQPNKI